MCILVSGHNINYVSEVICSILLMKMVKSLRTLQEEKENMMKWQIILKWN